MTSHKHRKEQLKRRLEQLDNRLHNIEEELLQHNDKDIEDHATEVEADEVLERIGTAGQDEIRMINAALARIEEGTYGECVRCGEEISEKRLDVLPYTPICRKCATAAEGKS